MMPSPPAPISLYDHLLQARGKLLLIHAACETGDEIDDPSLVLAIASAAREALAHLEPVREAIDLSALTAATPARPKGGA
jgi:hypothetical protein